MLKTKTVKVAKEEVTDILCNKCGNTCAKDLKSPLYSFSFASLKANWGYFSKKDFENHISHICEKCYDEFILSFKIKPTIKESDY